ncbi:M10 family metallopeptidase C-terminal domain-containing protein [Tardiphaga sp. OK245]|uniref:M10 family metallopeptidase C-terminal domain-containing protein n=1 Tax=Tardiphaga sp. OK245 TaxID=1855306 RepID=UPI0008A78889|nr:M10 family metallopeptidase C-terminal domain-containing protein [Tardiphaga sp. OK245]SEI19076.1 serralysin [Tardiphaga sp. OK245]
MVNLTRTGKLFSTHPNSEPDAPEWYATVGSDFQVEFSASNAQPIGMLHPQGTPIYDPFPLAADILSIQGERPDAHDKMRDAASSSDNVSGNESGVNAALIQAPIPTLANYLVNGFWQYNNTIAHHWGATTITYNINALTTAERFLAQSALNAWHEVTNLTFVQTTGAANITYTHNGTMTAYETDQYTGSGIIVSATINISADWITTDGGSYDGKTGIDSYGYQTYIHETGHALGLGHQGAYNGSASYATNALFANDTWQYSIMSYFSQPNFSGGSYRYVVTPQMADIYAVGSIYGAATTRTGDTVYGFNNTAGAIFDFSAYTRAPALTLYDSGGFDTLDCSGYSAAQTIDLRASTFSSVGGLANNIGIAIGTTIERAIGGSGNDTLIANDFGCTLVGGSGNDSLIGGNGNDILEGGIGRDVMTGGGGADVFRFAPLTSSPALLQHDLITDFTAGYDRIDLAGIDAQSGTAGIDAFTFMGASAFGGMAGQLGYFFDIARGVTVLQGDVNGDRIADFAIDIAGSISLTVSDLLGVAYITTVLEANGSTSLTQMAGQYYATSGGTGPALNIAGVSVVAGQTNNWTPIAVEAISGGYEVAWKLAGADQYIVWAADANGTLTSFKTSGVVSGFDYQFETLEASFNQDLNGDGTIGPITAVIESDGATSLTQIANNYFATSGGSGPALNIAGVNVIAGTNGWTPIAAEAISGGYEVAWKLTGADQYIVWAANSTGTLTSFKTDGVVSGAAYQLQALETSFHQDLNGDGSIGPITTVIESDGATSLTQIGNQYFGTTGGCGPALNIAGASVIAGTNNWTPIGAEAISGGYEVAWKLTGADQYIVWAADANGTLTSFKTSGVVSGFDYQLESLEASFHQDLNGDGTIGAVATVIESYGATSLAQIANNYFTSGGSSPALNIAGVNVIAGTNGWTPIAAEAISGGYEVAWKLTGADQYIVWSADTHGTLVSFKTNGVVSGSDPQLKSLETSFHQDLNGDAGIGMAQTPIGRIGNDSFVFKAGLQAEIDSTLNEHNVNHFVESEVLGGLAPLGTSANNILQSAITAGAENDVLDLHGFVSHQPVYGDDALFL